MDPSLGDVKHVRAAFRIAMMRLRSFQAFSVCADLLALSIEPERRKDS